MNKIGLSVAILALLSGEVWGASVKRVKTQQSWADAVLAGEGSRMGASAWKMSGDTDKVSATRQEDSRAAKRVPPKPGLTRTPTAQKIDSNEEYIPIKKANPEWKKPVAVKLPTYERRIEVEEVPDDTKVVIVGRVRTSYKKVSVRRINPDDEYGPENKVPPAKVVKAIYGDEDESSTALNQSGMSATKPSTSSIPSEQLPMILVKYKPAPLPPPSEEPVLKVDTVAAGTKTRKPAGSAGVQPNKPAPPAARGDRKKAGARPGVSSSNYMAANKPAPVQEESVPKEKPKPGIKTAVPVGPDSKAEFRSEMVVVSGSGKTVRMTTYLMAKNLLAEGDYIEANRYAEDWLEKNPDDWRGWQLLGNIQVELRHYGNALDSFKKSLKIRPDNPTLRHYVNQAEGIEE